MLAAFSTGILAIMCHGNQMKVAKKVKTTHVPHAWMDGKLQESDFIKANHNVNEFALQNYGNVSIN